MVQFAGEIDEKKRNVKSNQCNKKILATATKKSSTTSTIKQIITVDIHGARRPNEGIWTANGIERCDLCNSHSDVLLIDTFR